MNNPNLPLNHQNIDNLPIVDEEKADICCPECESNETYIVTEDDDPHTGLYSYRFFCDDCGYTKDFNNY